MTRKLLAILGLAAFALASSAMAETIPTLRCELTVSYAHSEAFLTVTDNVLRVVPLHGDPVETPVIVTSWSIDLGGGNRIDRITGQMYETQDGKEVVVGACVVAKAQF